MNVVNIPKYLCFSVLGILLSQTPSDAALFVEKINSTDTVQRLSDAEALFNGTGVSSKTSAYFDIINFTDAETDFGLFDNDASWPGVTVSDDAIPKNEPLNNHFAARITGNVHIPVTDIWTFGTTNDDGVQLSIDGQPLIVDDSLHPNRTFLESIHLEQGIHALELVFFERTNTAALELFAAQGNLEAFNNDFRLVGDTSNGGLATSKPSAQTVPEGSSIVGLLAISTVMLKKRNCKASNGHQLKLDVV